MNGILRALTVVLVWMVVNHGQVTCAQTSEGIYLTQVQKVRPRLIGPQQRLKALPDLVVTRLEKIQRESPTGGNLYLVTFFNQGMADSGECFIGEMIYNHRTRKISNNNLRIFLQPLRAREEKTYEFSLGRLSGSSERIGFVADISNDVKESNEMNNSRRR